MRKRYHGSSSSSRKMDMDALGVDETYFSALFDYDEVFPISDVNYATELHLQEALFSSLIGSKVETNHHRKLKRKFETMTKQQGERSIKIGKKPAKSSRTLCIICMDEKPTSEIFQGTSTCTHSYCTIRYVATKIKENSARIKCPDVECTRLIEPYMLRDLIPKDVFDRWENILCESLISTSDKLYCPFKNCSAMLMVDESNANVKETECPSCHRLFCAQCKVSWHAGVDCEEFLRYGNNKKKKRSDEDDAKFIKMAKSKQWKRCPNCKIYVDKVNGCLHISCRCGFHFCYGCGLKWSCSHVCRRT